MGDLFIVSSLKPSGLEMLTPSSVDVKIGYLEQFVAAQLLDLCSETCSRWFMSMRTCIARERMRQYSIREENGLPKSVRIPYERQPLTEAEHLAADYSESIIRRVFGDEPADYASKGFDRALSTGDMRSFKIRLVVLKIRDSLKGTSLYAEFSNGVEACIEKAELLAGCKPDNTPRRMSRAEKERARLKENKKRIEEWTNPELPLIWDDEKPEPKNPPVQDIEKSDFGVENTNRPKENDNDGSREVNQDIAPVTVTSKRNKLTSGEKPRKARSYETIDQILEDEENGKIVPYESFEEISDDLKAGRITTVEALMFTAAMDRRRIADDMDVGVDMGVDEENWGLEEFGEDEDIEEDTEPANSDDRSSSGFSINPMGFGGCSGRYSDSETEWNTDDNW